jgi:hypothetical protein
MVLTLTSSTSDTTSDNNVTWLGFETHAVCLVGTGRTGNTGDLVALTILPSTDTEKKPKGIGLLVTPQFFEVFVSWHDGILIEGWGER